MLGWCTFELCYWPARSFSRASHGYASLLCQWVLLHGWLTLMWLSVKKVSLLGVCDFPRCYRPVPSLCGSTNSCSIIYDHVFGYLIVSSRGMKAVFGIGSGPSKFYLNDDGASMIVRGIAAPSIFSQTIRYSKVSLDLAKKRTLYGKKNRFFWHWLLFASF